MEVDSMGKYIAKRLLWIIPVVLGVTVMVFTIMYLTPGDPARMILGFLLSICLSLYQYYAVCLFVCLFVSLLLCSTA